MAIPEPSGLLPDSQDEIIAYGRNCLHIGKIATIEFGRACQALLEGEGSWTQRRVAEVMECSQSTVKRGLDTIGYVEHKIIPESEKLRSDLEVEATPGKASTNVEPEVIEPTSIIPPERPSPVVQPEVDEPEEPGYCEPFNHWEDLGRSLLSFSKNHSARRPSENEVRQVIMRLKRVIKIMEKEYL